MSNSVKSIKEANILNLLIFYGFLIFLLTVNTAFSKQDRLSQCDHDVYDVYPWSLMYYHGWSSKRTLGSTFDCQFGYVNEDLDTIELLYTLSRENWLRYVFHYVFNMVQLGANLTHRDDRSGNKFIAESNAYLVFRWNRFPWNRRLYTTLAFAEGVSYASSVPSIEKRTSDKVGRFLNYLMFEVTFASPTKPRWQWVARIHHRSGCFGLYGAGNSGSNVVGFGIRYLF